MRDMKGREREPGWFASLLGAGVLIAGGFALGLVAGVVSEEPELVVGHLVGRSDQVAWTPDAEPGLTQPGEGAIALAAEAPAYARTESDAQERIEQLRPIEQAESEGASSPDVVWAAPQPALPEVAGALPEGPAALPEGPAALPEVAAAPPERRARREPRDIQSLPSALSPAAPSAQHVTQRAGFAVQVGAFSDGGAAESVRQKLRSKGFESYMIPATESGDGKWRVRVGPVPTKGAAQRLASRIKTEERLPTWVLAEGGG